MQYITMASQTSGTTERHFREKAINELTNAIYLSPHFTAAYYKLGQELELTGRLEEFLPFMNRSESGLHSDHSTRGWIFYKLALQVYNNKTLESRLDKVPSYLVAAEQELLKSKNPTDLEAFYQNLNSLIPVSVYRPLRKTNTTSPSSIPSSGNIKVNTLLKQAHSLEREMVRLKAPPSNPDDKLLNIYSQLLEIYTEQRDSESITQLLRRMAQFPGSLVHAISELSENVKVRLMSQVFHPEHVVVYSKHLLHENLIDDAYDVLYRRFLFNELVTIEHLAHIKSFFEDLDFTGPIRDRNTVASHSSQSQLWATELKVQVVKIVEREALRNPKVFQVGNVYGPPWPLARKRILINFDTSIMPPSQQIHTVKLFFYRAGGDLSYNLVLHPMESSWTSSEATWLSRSKKKQWQSPGGDFDDRLSIKAMLRVDRLECDLTDFWKARLKAHQNIFGFILRATDESVGTPTHPQYAHFHKEEHKLYPRLLVVSKSSRKPATNSLRYVEGGWNQAYGNGLHNLMAGNPEETILYWRSAAEAAPDNTIRREILDHISAIEGKMASIHKLKVTGK